MFNDTLVGLEIGRHTLKLVSGNYSMGKFILKSHSIIEKPDRAFFPNDVLNHEIMAPYLKEVFRANKISRKNFHIVINTDKTILRERVLPKAGMAELHNISKFEIEQFLPYSVDDFVVDFRVLSVGTEESEESLNTLVAAVPRDIIDSHMIASKKCGFRIKTINIYSECLGRFMESFTPYPDENVLIVDVGAHLTRLTIFKNNKYFATFNSDLGGEEATRQLAREHHLDLKEAETKKINMGLAMTKEFFDKKSLSGFDFNQSILITDYCDSLGAEISRVINFFRTRKISGIIHRVVLIGGGSQIKEMDKYLQGILGVDVDYFIKSDRMNSLGNNTETDFADLDKIIPAIGAILRRPSYE
jgi:type IV pilus assembly protein PilM